MNMSSIYRNISEIEDRLNWNKEQLAQFIRYYSTEKVKSILSKRGKEIDTNWLSHRPIEELIKMARDVANVCEELITGIYKG